jgi:hypothetical protein
MGAFVKHEMILQITGYHMILRTYSVYIVVDDPSTESSHHFDTPP